MSAPWPEELPQGFEFEQYELLDCIWRGSLASVYRAESPGHGLVALKVFNPVKIEKRTLQRRLSRSARSASVRHPNLAAVLASGEWRERAYVVSEWLDGCDLEDYLDRFGPMSQDEVAELGLHLVSGLMALHHAGALHGDIKPSSVFLCNGPDGDVIPKLLLSELPDFGGLSSPVDSTTRQVALSTPAYLAPEAVRGRDVGPAADQYSVCAVLYECAVGHPPFQGESLLELLRSMATGSIEAPRAVRPELSEALEAALLRGLKTEPGERFESLRELGRALWPLVSERAREPWARSFGAPARAAPREAPRRFALPANAAKSASKAPSKGLLVAASIAALSIGIGAFYLYSTRSDASRSEPPRAGSERDPERSGAGALPSPAESGASSTPGSGTRMQF